MQFRVAVTTLTLLLVALLPHSAAAQQYCSTLSRADCDLYYRTGMDVPASASFDMTAVTQFGTGFEVFDFTLNMSGSYITDAEATAQFEAATAEVEANPTLALTRELIDIGLLAFDADLQASLEVPQELAAGAFLSPLSVDLWYVDGIGYVDLTELGVSLFDPTISGTYGFDLTSAASFGMGMLDEESWAEIVADADLDDLQAESATPISLKETLIVNEATTITRDDEAPADLAAFTTVIDLLPLLKLPSVRAAAIESQTEDGTLSEEEAEAIIDAFVGSTQTDGIILREVIDPANRRSTSINFFLDMTIDTTAFANAYGAQTGDYNTFGQGFGPVDFVIDVNINRDTFDDVSPIQPPKEADIISLFEIFTLLGE